MGSSTVGHTDESNWRLSFGSWRTIECEKVRIVLHIRASQLFGWTWRQCFSGNIYNFFVGSLNLLHISLLGLCEWRSLLALHGDDTHPTFDNKGQYMFHKRSDLFRSWRSNFDPRFRTYAEFCNQTCAYLFRTGSIVNQLTICFWSYNLINWFRK